MRRLIPTRAPLLVALCLTLGACGASHSPGQSMPRAASDFRDSVGVNTHNVYFDTAYGDWPRILAELARLGVRHVRDGIFADPAPQSSAFNEHFYRAVDAAVAQGLRFDFVAGKPNNPTGTIDQLVGVAAGRLRAATEALEGPNEYDAGQPVGWVGALRAYQRALFAAVRAQDPLRGVPVVGPSLIGATQGQLGSLSDALDIGNIHPYSGGDPPSGALLERNLSAAAIVSGPKRTYATEVGFDNALSATTGQAPVPEDVAGAYVLRTLLEHFDSGVQRTYLYELIDEKPDPGGLSPEQHFGLLRNDFTEKPAFIGVRDLLLLLGDPRPPEQLTPLSLGLRAPGVHSLLLQRTDGRHLLALWTDAPLWDIARRRRLDPPPQRVSLRVPANTTVTEYQPLQGASGVAVPHTGASLSLPLGAGPVILELSG